MNAFYIFLCFFSSEVLSNQLIFKRLTSFLGDEDKINFYFSINNEADLDLDEIDIYKLNYNAITRRFIPTFQDRLDWDVLSVKFNFSMFELKKYHQRINWCLYSHFQKLTQRVLHWGRPKLCWSCVSRNENMSEYDLLRHKDKIDVGLAYYCRRVYHFNFFYQIRELNLNQNDLTLRCKCGTDGLLSPSIHSYREVLRILKSRAKSRLSNSKISSTRSNLSSSSVFSVVEDFGKLRR